MLAKVFSYGIAGLDAYPVTIEVDVASGLPATRIVGLPDNAVKESKERVRSAIKNSGYEYKWQRITVNLSPADIKKEGPSFDLAIALGVLAGTEQIPAGALADFVVLGELSLDGQIRPVNGVLSIALALRDTKFKGLILPQANAHEAAVTKEVPVYPVRNLQDVIHFLQDPAARSPFRLDADFLSQPENSYDVDFAEVKGQTHVKRGLEIAAAGSHNVLMIGPPGSGKTMLARRLTTILPDMTLAEALETTKIHSCVGQVPSGTALLFNRPFRSPHHTSSSVALVGGGPLPKPGEVTLAHNGILFLDELPEFNRNVLEALREPLEDHTVTVARAAKTIRFPAKLMLVASMNPCPCGYYTDPRRSCRCHSIQIQKYHSRISGPLLDRIDIHLEVPALRPVDLLAPAAAESSSQIKQRTMEARRIQRERFSASGGSASGGQGTSIHANAQMNHKCIREFCPLTPEGSDLIRRAIEELNLSARAHDKILKLARTIADLDEKKEIQPDHVAEAIQYRSLDRNWWG